MMRDFTYIDDIAEGVVRVLDRLASADPGFDSANPDPARSDAPYRVFNIGNSDPVPLMDFIHAIEQAVGRKAEKNYLPLQDGDVPATSADVSELAEWTGFKPDTPVPQGVGRFVEWYRNYFKP
jgi:UDP-glucuronate 4-epimerase